jgi:D-hexose-6-phosphate mutarotase
MADELRAADLPEVARIIDGPGGLAVLAIRSSLAAADIFLHGAQLTHWKPAGVEPVIFLSEHSVFEEGKAIRGGVPICFPWFGPRPGDGAHGFVRNQAWELDEVGVDDGGIARVVLGIASTPATLKRWPHSFRARMIYVIGTTLEMTLEVQNTGQESFTYSEALHTYFIVGDSRHARVTGLEETDYRDFPDRTQITRQRGAIEFTAETDRVYVNTRAACVLEDPSLRRRIVVEKSGSDTTTVWNPWIAKSAALADFGDDEWKRMVCIETVNAFENSVTLPPGKVHRMTAKISVQPL